MNHSSSCGETREATAARIHQIAAGLWRAERSLALALGVVAGAMIAVAAAIAAVSTPSARWHDASTTVHKQRAIEKGEVP